MSPLLSFSGSALSLSSCVLFGSVAAVLYLSYRAILPRPIPGIPYNKNAVKSVLGDMPSMARHHGTTQEVFTWMTQQCVDLNSPVIQLFLHPFGRPVVFIVDFRESMDILLRRTKEFDRSNFFGDLFVGLLPAHHISMPTNATFKHQRRLLADTMSSAFLADTAAPQIYTAATELMRLWRIKAELAAGHPFDAPKDVHRMALDAIWAVAFGDKIGTTTSQLQALSETQALDLPANIDAEVVFPQAPTPPAFDSIMTLTDTLEVTITSPVPRLSHWFVRQFPAYKTAKGHKDRLIKKSLIQARSKFWGDTTKGEVVRSAIDHMMRREWLAAGKESREPEFDTPAVQDELFGFLIAGHETTSTTVTWGLKLLTDHPEVQQKLRQSLFSCFPEEVVKKTVPSAEAIAKSEIAFLDATLEEVFRCSKTTPGQQRKALVDTVVLGHHIPKGTDVFAMSNGPGFLSKPIDVDEPSRSPSSRAAKDRVGVWDEANMAAFMPERWLRRDEKGELEFDYQSGPNLPFGLGVRGCFGRRLAYLELRIMLTLILWNFHLGKTPAELSSYRAVDKITHQPQQCYLRLTPVDR